MKVEVFMDSILELGIRTLVGVPDSTLKQFCSYNELLVRSRDDIKHYTAPNEGAAAGIATGVYLGTGVPALVYMQNSGIGNAVNPITSIMNELVYDIPAVYVIGWRGEPGQKDEPQHKYMGLITESMLNDLSIPYAIIGNETSEEELTGLFDRAKEALKSNKSFAFLVKKDTFEAGFNLKYENLFTLVREDAITAILKRVQPSDVIVSTTGKISRELYEQSEELLGQHSQAFLTVGGMGHASMIAYGIAVNKPDKRVYCIDGDGAVLMHMGSLAFIGKSGVHNFIHICLNNDSHESVGGMPTGAVGLDYAEVARVCGYKQVFTVSCKEDLELILDRVKYSQDLVFIEVLVSLVARDNLGRPKESAVENKANFIKYHEGV